MLEFLPAVLEYLRLQDRIAIIDMDIQTVGQEKCCGDTVITFLCAVPNSVSNPTFNWVLNILYFLPPSPKKKIIIIIFHVILRETSP